MKDLLFIASGAGLQNGINPCIFMSCAVFIVYCLWLKKSFVEFIWMRVVFGLAYASGILFFYFGPGQAFILRRNFVLSAKAVYFILSIGFFVLGILFIKDWYLIRRGLPARGLTDGRIKPFAVNGIVVYLTILLLAVALSALATLWPMDNYIFLLGNEALLRGQWKTLVTLLAGYVSFSLLPLWVIWAILSIKNLKSSLFKIICAVVFFTASSCMILIFK